MNSTLTRRDLLASSVGVTMGLAGCASDSNTGGPQQSGESRFGSDVDVESGLLIGTQLPDPFMLNYDSESAVQLANSPTPVDGYSNRFVNQEASGEDIVFIESVIGRYETESVAANGLKSTHEEYEKNMSSTVMNGDSIGAYHIFSLDNENGYTTTVFLNQYGNILHGVLAVGKDKYQDKVIELGQLQFLQIQQFDA